MKTFLTILLTVELIAEENGPNTELTYHDFGSHNVNNFIRISSLTSRYPYCYNYYVAVALISSSVSCIVLGYYLTTEPFRVGCARHCLSRYASYTLQQYLESPH